MATAYTERLTLFVTPSVKREIVTIAEAEGISESAAARRALMRQLRYERMDSWRRAHGKGPYRRGTLQLSQAEADAKADSLLKEHPDATESQLFAAILTRAAKEQGDGKPIRAAKRAAIRVINQQEAEALERGFSRKNREHDFRDAAETFENENQGT